MPILRNNEHNVLLALMLEAECYKQGKLEGQISVRNAKGMRNYIRAAVPPCRDIIRAH